MATHSSVLAWRSPGTGEPVGLPSVGSHRVGLKRLSSSSSSEAGRLEGAGAGRNFPILVEIKFQNFPQLSAYPWRVSHCYGEGSEQYFLLSTPLLLQDP